MAWKMVVAEMFAKRISDEMGKDEAVSFLERVRTGTLTPKEDKMFEDPSFTIWDHPRDFWGKRYDAEGRDDWEPMMTVDGWVYEALNYGEYGAEKWNKVMREYLGDIGCYPEPYSNAVWEAVCENEFIPKE